MDDLRHPNSCSHGVFRIYGCRGGAIRTSRKGTYFAWRPLVVIKNDRNWPDTLNEYLPGADKFRVHDTLTYRTTNNLPKPGTLVGAAVKLTFPTALKRVAGCRTDIALSFERYRFHLQPNGRCHILGTVNGRTLLHKHTSRQWRSCRLRNAESCYERDGERNKNQYSHEFLHTNSPSCYGTNKSANRPHELSRFFSCCHYYLLSLFCKNNMSSPKTICFYLKISKSKITNIFYIIPINKKVNKKAASYETAYFIRNFCQQQRQ